MKNVNPDIKHVESIEDRLRILETEMKKITIVQRDLITMQMHVYSQHFKPTEPDPLAKSPRRERNDSKSNTKTTKSKKA